MPSSFLYKKGTVKNSFLQLLRGGRKNMFSRTLYLMSCDTLDCSATENA